MLVSSRSFSSALCLAGLLAGLSVGILAQAQEPKQSASGGGPRSTLSEQPPPPGSEPPRSEPQSPMDAFWSLLEEWERFEREWSAFYPTLEALGLELGELPSYLESLETSLKAEREGRKADEEANAIDRAADRLALESMTSERNAWRTGAGISAGAALFFILLYFFGR